jgi:hypothetical protein
LVLDRQHIAKFASRKRFPLNETSEHLLLKIALPVALRLGDNLQMDRCRIRGNKLQGHGGRCRSGTVLTQQDQSLADAAEVEVGVAEGMDVTGAAESLAGGDSPDRVFSGVVHQHDREVELSLQ